jgi:hypothetical protein
VAEDPPIDPRVLPDLPNVWSSAEYLEYKQRWLPGAFGDRETIEGVLRFVVEEDVWEEIDGVQHRTISKARIL